LSRAKSRKQGAKRRDRREEGSRGLHFLLLLSMEPPLRSYSSGGRASATGEILPRWRSSE
ncbi:MAG: hypothetical protein AAF804_06070, partial [Bacteroidota bacterium]